MKKIIGFFSCFFVLSNFCPAQNSVNSNGQTISNASYSFDHSLGEVSSITASNSSFTFTQGFNQPSYFGSTIKESDKNLTFKVYPNPTEDNLFISYSGIENSNVIVTLNDIKGISVLKETISTPQTKSINLKTFSAGEYILILTNIATNKTNQYKIIKTK